MNARWLQAVAVVVALLLGAGCRHEANTIDLETADFVRIKQSQARSLVESGNYRMPPDGWKLFTAILEDDFNSATNLFARLALIRSSSTNTPNAASMAVDQIQTFLATHGLYTPSGSALDGSPWQTLSEAYWAYFEVKTWQSPLLKEVVSNIVSVIPSNAVYFGGTDIGRFSVDASQEASKNARRFFILTQNQLMDYGYCEYAQFIYGPALILPSASDCNAAWGRLLRATTSKVTQAAVMRESGELIRMIMAQNPDGEFFIEQSLIIEWLYPHLSPHGPILKINRQPLARLAEETVRADNAYWAAFCGKYIGNWIKVGETKVAEVCDFSERVYLRKELQGFSGDRQYLACLRAQDYFAKLRLATALLYLWRCVEATQVEEKSRMWTQCVLAFEQAFALGPVNSEVASHFADTLVSVKEYDDAIRVLRICFALNPGQTALRAEIERIGKLAASAH